MSMLRAPIVLIYAAALLQGLTLVSFPASSVVLRTDHGLSAAQYGLIFLPQVAAAIVGALVGGALARQLGLKRLLVIALLCNSASQALLSTVQWLPPTTIMPILLVATASLGLGFGFFGAPMNTYPPLLFPGTADTAIVAEHSVMGVGLMAGPLLLGLITNRLSWVGFPLSLTALGLVLALLAASTKLESGAAALKKGLPAERPPLTSSLFWAFASCAVLYAFAEGTFSNWAVIYLQDVHHFAPAEAALGLSMFWGGLVGGRLLTSVLVLRIPAATIWLILPLLMALAFWLLPSVKSASMGWLIFAFAGAACSAFFPLTVALASSRFPQHAAWVSSMLIAALNVGTGLGSYLVGLMHESLSLETVYRSSIAYPSAVLFIAVSALSKNRSMPVRPPA